jgi:hypothetical protein
LDQMKERTGDRFHIDGGLQSGGQTGHVTVLDHGASVQIAQHSERGQLVPGASGAAIGDGVLVDQQVDFGCGGGTVVIDDRGDDVDRHFQIQTTAVIDQLSVLHDGHIGGRDTVFEGLTSAGRSPVEGFLVRLANVGTEGEGQARSQYDSGQHVF